MRQEIVTHIENPRELEKLFRSNKSQFKKEFNAIYPDIDTYELARFWNERLNYQQSEIKWGGIEEIGYLITACMIAGIIAKLPEITNINEQVFYQRYIGYIVFPILIGYFAWINKIDLKRLAIAISLLLGSLLFMRFFPPIIKSDTLILSSLHVVFFQWAILGFIYSSGNKSRIDYLKFNADLIILSVLILIGGILLTVATLSLFEMAGMSITEFYLSWVVVFGLASAPIVSAYFLNVNPELVSKISSFIARLFSPLALITISIYLVIVVANGKNPYLDRDFLLVFNLVLVGVLGIMIFSVIESEDHISPFNKTILLFLSVVTIIVNLIALSAIVFRISQWGLSPNRMAVLGGNLLFLSNLILIGYHLIRSYFKNEGLNPLIRSFSVFLPVYALWTVIVTFIFPIIYNFK